MEVAIPPFAIGTIQLIHEPQYNFLYEQWQLKFEDYSTKVGLIKYAKNVIALRLYFDHPQAKLGRNIYWEIPFNTIENENEPYFSNYDIFKINALEYIIEGRIVDPIQHSFDSYHWHFIAKINRGSLLEKHLVYWDVTE